MEIRSRRTIAPVKPVFVPPRDVKVGLACPFRHFQVMVFHPEEVVDGNEEEKHDSAGNERIGPHCNGVVVTCAVVHKYLPC